MKSVNYYIRENNHPVTAVTVLTHENMVSRGVAICNKCDQFEKIVGRELSKDRAIKAFNNKKSYGEIRLDSPHVDEKYLFKCEYMPELTNYEIELLAEPIDE